MAVACFHQIPAAESVWPCCVLESVKITDVRYIKAEFVR